MNAITIGIDLAKSVFQVHGIDAAGGAGWSSVRNFAARRF